MLNAREISDLFNNDRFKFMDKDGHSLFDVCDDNAVEKDNNWEHGATKWVFDDESVIVAQGECWDVGYMDCWCCRDFGHDDDCTQRAFGVVG